MENAITAALSKQIVLQRALEVTANNVANQTTAGFKAEKLAFREYVANLDIGAASHRQDADVSLVFDPDSYTDFSAAALDVTHGDFDFAIDGEGFFAIETASGERYTRDGRFVVNGAGELVTQDGARVLDDNGAPILIDPEAGPIAMTPNGELQQDGTTIGALGVFVFDDEATLTREGANLFSSDRQPTAAEFPRVQQGFLETSNVQPISAMTDMVEILRSYQQTAQLLETANELARTAVERLSENA